MRPRRPRLLAAAGAAAAALLCAAAPASAQTTLGELAPPAATTGFCKGGPYEVVPGGTAAPLYTVPAAGVITSWSTQAGIGPGQELTFKAFRPAGAGASFPEFTVLGRDGPRALAEGAIDTFGVEIPVAAGDLIGLNDADAGVVSNSCVFAGAPGDRLLLRAGDAPVGGTFEAEGDEEDEGMRPNLTATLLLAPTISSLSPAGGPAVGGTRVTITGTEFADVKAVTVGSATVAFEVVSETEITATAPPGPAGPSVPVTVRTAAGSASRSFAYEAAPAPPTPAPPATTAAPSCKVPKLRHRRLKAARRVLRKRHCRIGKVTRRKGVRAGKARVIRQRPRPGTLRRAGAKVGVRLG